MKHLEVVQVLQPLYATSRSSVLRVNSFYNEENLSVSSINNLQEVVSKKIFSEHLVWNRAREFQAVKTHVCMPPDIIIQASCSWWRKTFKTVIRKISLFVEFFFGSKGNKKRSNTAQVFLEISTSHLTKCVKGLFSSINGPRKIRLPCRLKLKQRNFKVSCFMFVVD